MKKIILTIFCFLLLTTLFSQVPVVQWAKTMGNTGSDEGYSLATDPSSNILMAGKFNATVDFDPGAGTLNLNSMGGDDIFISKSDTFGNLLWAKSMGATGTDIGYNVTSDAAGNIFVTGTYQNTVDFDPSAGVFNLTSNGLDDMFISKLDGSGNFLWARSMGGTSSDLSQSIAVDAAGNVYTTGSFGGTVDFDPGGGTFNLTATSSSDIFISKLNSAGNFVWAKSIGSTGFNFGLSIKVDNTGNLLITGQFNGSTDFDPGAGTAILNTSVPDIYILKLDAAGNYLWADAMGASAGPNSGNALATDASGNTYVAGYYNGTMDFDPGVGTYTLTSAGNNDIFVSKIDGAGNFVWAVSMGGSGADQATAIGLDTLGNIYVTGDFSGNANFASHSLFSAGSNDAFIFELNTSGNLWAITAIGGSAFDEGQSLAVTTSGSVYTSGYFNGSSNFDYCGTSFNLASAGAEDIFLHKMSPVALFSGNTTICSGSSVSLSAGGGTSYNWNCPGGTPATSSAQNPVILYTTAGTYTTTLSVNTSCFVYQLSPLINVLPYPAVTATGSATICAGNSTTLTGAGASSYVWSPASGLSCTSCISPVANPTNSTTYTVTGTNAGGCSNTNSVTVTVDPPPVITISGNTNVCAGNFTTLTASGAATYQWSGGATTAMVTALSAGTYTVIGTNAQGCTASKVVTVISNALPTVSISASSTSICSGSSSTLTASGASTYSWSTGETGASISVSPTASVTYTVTGTNAAGCTATKTIVVAGHLPIPITTTATPTACGLNSGTVAASVSGPGAIPPFSYLWTCGTTASALSGLDAGIYRVDVIDGIGCFSFADALITSSNGPTLLTNSVTAVSCAGLSNGAVDINVTGSAQPYTFAWSDGTTTEDINNVSFGPYEVIVTDAGGCSAVKSIFVPEPAVLSLSYSSAVASCATSNGSANVVVSGGNIPYTYLWSSGSSVTSATGLAAGVYTVSVTDSKGCIDSLLVGVQDNGGPPVAVDTVAAVDCGANGFVLIVPQDSGRVASYMWTTGSTTQNLINAAIGNYGVVVTDTGGCKSILIIPVKPVLPPVKPICLVTVDTTTAMNIIVWEKPVSTIVAGFRIYRESSQNGIYQFIHYQPYSLLSTYLDSIARPDDRWAKYRISMIDICGKESPFSDEHKTIHLSIQSTTADSTFLIWDKYVGYPFSYYHIFRKDSALAPWYLLDSVPASTTFYIDKAVPHSSDTTTIFYHVDVSHSGGDCIATIAKGPDPMSATVKSSKSNGSDRVSEPSTGIHEYYNSKNILVYPNPSHGLFTIKDLQHNLQTASVKVYNVLGEEIYQLPSQPVNQLTIDLRGNAKGVYHLQLLSGNTIINKKIVIE